MNSKFNDKQIRAYVSAFEEGDAIWCNGEWHEVFYKSKRLINTSLNTHFMTTFDGNPATKGFKHDEHPYRITTLEEYEYNGEGGEKIIWLGESDNRHTFGRVYSVADYGYRDIRYVDDEGDFMIATGVLWGVIPRYNQVTEQQKEDSSETVEQKVTNSKPKSETTDIAQTLYKRYKNNLKTLLHNDILDALKQKDYLKVAELSKLMAELKKQS